MRAIAEAMIREDGGRRSYLVRTARRTKRPPSALITTR